MFWLSPWLPFGVACAAIASAYFFRHRSKVVDVPAVTVWLRVGRPVRVRSLGTILAALASLALQFLIVGLILLALLDPFPKQAVTRRVVVIIDASATMQTRENGVSRLEQAVQSARQVLSALSGDAQVTVVIASARPRLAQPKLDTPQSAIAALDRIEPVDTDADLPAALRTIGYLAADPAARVVVISDFAGIDESTLRSAWGGQATLELSPVARDQPDAAITDLWQQPQRDRQTIGVRVAARAMDGQTAAVVLRAAGREIARKSVTLGGGPSQAVEFDAALPAGTPFDVKIEAADALACDDAAYGVTGRGLRPVVLVTDDAPVLLKALRAEPDLAVRVVRPADFDGQAADATVIFDETCQGRLDRLTGGIGSVKAAGVLLIGTADPFASAPATFVDAPKATHWAASHLVLTGLAGDTIRFDRALTGPTALAAKPVLSAGDVPLIAEGVTGDAKVVAWRFRLADTDLPQRVAFPVLLWNTLDYLRGVEANPQPWTTDRPVSLPALAATKAVGPDGSTVQLRSRVDGTTFGVDHAGVYALDDPAKTAVGVSYLSSRPLQPLPTIERTPAAVVIPATWRRPSWQWIVLAAGALMLVELALYRTNVLRVGT